MSKSETSKKPTRDERLAEQLRANLRRRKAASKRQDKALKFDEASGQKNTPSSP